MSSQTEAGTRSEQKYRPLSTAKKKRDLSFSLTPQGLYFFAQIFSLQTNLILAVHTTAFMDDFPQRFTIFQKHFWKLDTERSLQTRGVSIIQTSLQTNPQSLQRPNECYFWPVLRCWRYYIHCVLLCQAPAGSWGPPGWEALIESERVGREIVLRDREITVKIKREKMTATNNRHLMKDNTDHPLWGRNKTLSPFCSSLLPLCRWRQ